MSFALSVCTSTLLLATCAAYRFIRIPVTYPPGPRGLPLLNNIFDMPRCLEWETFSRWASQYGDVVHVKIFGKRIVLLSSVKAVADLLDKRSLFYSDRPHFPLIDLAGQQFNFGFMPYGQHWASRRRTFAAHFGRSSPEIYPSHYTAVACLLQNLYKKPTDFMDHVRLHAAQLILGVTYGLKVESCEDRLVRNAQTVMDNVSFAVRPEMWILNPMLILSYLPSWLGGDYLAHRVQQWQTEARELRERPYSMAIENNDGTPSFVGQLVETRSPHVDVQEHTDHTMDCAAVAFGGGSDTTVSAANSFFLAMAMNPQVQRKATEEIERVVGTGRLPNFDDRPNLPYISAIARETIRWQPPTPAGIPHLLTQDDTYRGYSLPKGSVIVGNIWHILHDPAIHTRPSVFEPERHLEDGKLMSDDASRVAFGFGRRVCPGKAFAEDSLWLVIAQVLATFTIETDRPLEARFTSGAISHPSPFRCEIKPRSEDALILLQLLS